MKTQFQLNLCFLSNFWNLENYKIISLIWITFCTLILNVIMIYFQKQFYYLDESDVQYIKISSFWQKSTICIGKLYFCSIKALAISF